MKKLFFDEDLNRLRLVWRVVFQTILMGFLLIVFTTSGTLAYTLISINTGLPAPAILSGDVNAVLGGWFGVVFAWGTLAAILLSVWVAGRLFDKRRFSDFGFRLSPDWWADLVFGLGLGAGLMGVIFLVERAAGWVTVTGYAQSPENGSPFASSFLAGALLFIAVGIYEEVFSRGYHLVNLREGFGFLGKNGAILVSVVGSAAVFGVLHLTNPNVTALSVFNISLVGVVFAVMVLLTGDLAAPIGFHIAWNFFQGNVFGFPVSGVFPGTTLIQIEQTGPELLTGGLFGPEAGLLGTASLLVGLGAFLVWVKVRKGKIGVEYK